MAKTRAQTIREAMRQLRMMIRFEQRLRRDIAAEKNKVLNLVIDRAARDLTPPGLPELLAHREGMAKVLQRAYAQLIPQFGVLAEGAQKNIPHSWQKKQNEALYDQLIEEWILLHGLEQSVEITGMAQTTLNDVRRTIETGVAAGEGIDRIRRRLTQLRVVNNSRAAMIARTEVHNAANFATIETSRVLMRETGLQMLKEWVPTEDERTRPGHREMAGRPPIEIDGKFQVRPDESSPYESLDRPGDPAGSAGNVINCRCVLVFSSPEIEFTE